MASTWLAGFGGIPDHKFKHSGRCGVGMEVIEAVPYDRYLRCFLVTLASHPPQNTTR